MKRCENNSNSRRGWSHVYVEQGAFETALGRRILSSLPDATVVPVRRYKDVFNRRRQDFAVQKAHPALILAVKQPPFLYPVSEQCQRFGAGPSVYTTPALNCPYDCAYCFLCGLYDSAYPVVFVNTDDFFHHTEAAATAAASRGEGLSLHLSYESDLLAFEAWTGLCADWMRFTQRTPRLTVELRTKSAAYPFDGAAAPSDRFVLAWSIAPVEVVRRYERRTPSLKARLRAAAKAAGDGHPVRLCIDPVIAVPEGESAYRRMFEQAFENLPPDAVRDAAVGPFRAGTDHLRRMKQLRPGSDLFSDVSQQEHERLSDAVAKMAAEYLGKEKVVGWRSQS